MHSIPAVTKILMCAHDIKIPHKSNNFFSFMHIQPQCHMTLCVCSGPKASWPPLSTVVPEEPMLTRPSGSTCGQVSSGRLNGMFTAPGYPNYQHNLDCAYVVKVPKGYYVQFMLPNFTIEER